MKSILAIAGLTVRASIRYRFFIVMAISLVLLVYLLPVMLKHDGTAEGLLQILITYTLGAVFLLLGASTLWMSCGVLSRDIEDCTIQVLVVKPVAKWKIWFGKWLGIFFINFFMLKLCGLFLFGLIAQRAAQLPQEQQIILQEELLVGRGVVNRMIDDPLPLVNEIYKERMKTSPEFAMLKTEYAMTQLEKQVRAENQTIPSYHGRIFDVDLGGVIGKVKDKPLQLQLKFNPSGKDLNNRYSLNLILGNTASTNSVSKQVVLPANRATAISIPANLVDEQGKISVQIQNMSNFDLSFPEEDGIQILFNEYGFRLNFMRGLEILLFWLSLLSAIGLAAGSFLSFPVASFLSLSVLLIGMCTGMLTEVVEDGTLLTAGFKGPLLIRIAVDVVFLSIFKAIVTIFGWAMGYSPIEQISTGRSISWTQMFLGFLQIVVLMGGVCAAFGMTVFSRRELATAQNQQ
ncbi:hypothetical protein N9B94_00470 [Verrucomicrobia bacterium]|nr:hypothetical protein [Verrucomicrobiota bacterium]